MSTLKNTKVKKILLVIAAVVGIFIASKPEEAEAASNYAITSSYTVVANSPMGINKTIHMQAYNNNKHHFTDIIMYDKYGAVVWQKNNAIAYSGQGSFWCEPNVAKVAVRVGYSNPLGFFSPRVGSINVWY